jgi:hypothetical protein
VAEGEFGAIVMIGAETGGGLVAGAIDGLVGEGPADVLAAGAAVHPARRVATRANASLFIPPPEVQ